VLNWKPEVDLDESISKTVNWHIVVNWHIENKRLVNSE
jgi:dTDP-D-glucose 4,6-dehydratase